MKKIFVLIILLISLCSYAKDASVEGYGDSAEASKNNALAELSFVIYSDVSASVSQTAQTDFKTSDVKLSKQIDITSELPIIGADINTEKVKDGYKTTATLGASASQMYAEKLEETSERITREYKAYLSEDSDSEKYDRLSNTASALDNFEKLNSVYLYLADKNYPAPAVSKDEVASLLKKMTAGYKDMKLCASVMAKELKKDGVYLYYPMNDQSDEVTEFASAFRGLMAGYLKPVNDIESAEYYINTQYSVTKTGMYLTAYLTDKDGKTLDVSSKILLPQAYKGLDTEPSSVSFEKLLKMGMANSSDLTARIMANKGKRAVLYKKGDTVELFIKVNKPSYVYIMGHVVKGKEQYSYLLDMFDADDNRRFIRYIDADEINRWISIGKFEVVPPLGSEVFQMFASVNDPYDSLPSYVFDVDENMYKVSDNPSKEVRAMRALKRVESAKNEQSEDVLIFSSTDK